MTKQEYIDDLREEEQECINQELMRDVEDDFADHSAMQGKYKSDDPTMKTRTTDTKGNADVL